MTRDRRVTYRWTQPRATPTGPVIDLYEAGSIRHYTLQALEAALAAEKAATRPTGRHVCGFKFERDRLDRIRKFEQGLALIKSTTNTNPNNQE